MPRTQGRKATYGREACAAAVYVVGFLAGLIGGCVGEAAVDEDSVELVAPGTALKLAATASW